MADQESDLLSILEERVVKAVEAVNTLRREKAALEKDVLSLEEAKLVLEDDKLKLAGDVERLTAELDAVRSKNKSAASRISKLLEQMDLPATS